ncbi:gp58-like family protein [Pediococcus pentosaceus]|uniref:gp58-like family protein n=1 Tax=Pediococcus pentosaceus TaxID=1255 RepID=UPI0021E6D9B2|nr:gp58-like family protein [Pediococcus pentosaceus]MCV3330511.1 gp58-like family protein [Pediococcus pentosaceus]
MIIGSATANIDDNLEKANDAKDIAIVANNGVKDINSDNKLTPNEKISLKRLYDSDVLKHDFDVKQLTSMSLPTADIDLALSNLTAFTARYFVNMDITEEVDQQALNKVFNDFDNADKAVEGLFNDAVQRVADDAKKAGDDAKAAGEQAQATGEAAKQAADQAKADATQAKADAATAQQKAQSSIDQLNNHLPDINEALSTANLVKQDVTKLSDTTEQYHNEYTTGIQNVISTVNNMTISNRNLALGTATVFTMTGENRSNQVQDGCYGFSSVIPLGTVVTISFDVSSSTGVGDFTMQFYGGEPDGKPASSWQIISEGSLVNGTKHISVTLTTDSDHLHVRPRLDNATGTVTISNFIISESSKEVSWSPAPEDLATSSEIDQLSNAIKLKADSSDVTSQITVATKGIQNEVDNKVTDLNTKISQTSDVVQILTSTSGSRNLVYNATFEQTTNGFPAGWTKDSNASNESGYVSSVPASSYQGRSSIEINTSKELGWVKFAQSDSQPLPIDNSTDAINNVYSASMMVKAYGDGGAKASGHVFITLAFFDANKVRIEDNVKGTWSQTATDSNEQWQLVKVENSVPPANAKYVGIQAFTYSVPTHAMINQPMINIGATVQPFKPDMVNQASITASINDINLGVKNANGATSTFNMNGDTILLDANKILFNGNTSILDGTIGTAKIANAAINTAQIVDGAINNAKIANAAIDDAKISNLDGNKIIAGSITSKQLNANDIIANVINGKTINGITITTPNLQLGTNGILSEDWSLNQATSLFNPKKGSGTMTLTKGLLATNGTLSRWWSDDGGYWYGIGDDGSKIKNGSNQVGDNYGAGYAQHNIFDSKGNTLLRTYMDATGLYMNSGGTSNVNTVLTQQGLTTTNVTALGDINGASLTTSSWVEAGIGSGNGIRIGFRTIQSHNTQDLYFNGDDNKQSVTLHAKSIIQSSQLSRKKDIKPLDPDYAMQVIRESDMYGYRYNEEAPTEPLHFSGIIDDVNGTPQYKMPAEFISEDRTGRNDGNTVAFLVEALKQADKRIGILEGMMNSD